MTKYLSKEPFSVSGAGVKKFEENWETTFGKGREKCPQCGSASVRVFALDKDVRTCRSCLAEWRVPEVSCG